MYWCWSVFSHWGGYSIVCSALKGEMNWTDTKEATKAENIWSKIAIGLFAIDFARKIVNMRGGSVKDI